MTEHDWQPIAPPEDKGIMCTVCFECKCCSDWTDDCPGEWVPEDDVQYADADADTVMSVAQRISEQNAELMRRLS